MAKATPILSFQPGSVSGNSHSFIPAIQCPTQFVVPRTGHSLHIENSIFQIPFPRMKNFYASSGQVFIKLRYRSSQSAPGLRFSDGFRNNPYAEFLVFKPGLEVEHRHLNQFSFGRVEIAEMRSPRSISDWADSRIPQFTRHQFARHPHFHGKLSFSLADCDAIPPRISSL